MDHALFNVDQRCGIIAHNRESAEVIFRDKARDVVTGSLPAVPVDGIAVIESTAECQDGDFSGDAEKMWQEYPSTHQEAFQVSTEGMYYAFQLTSDRKAGRIGLVRYVEGVPVNTFWDIGNSDGTGIWLHQRVGLQNRFIKYIEGWGEPYSFYVRELQALGYVWGKHHLPHDAEHKRQLAETIAAPRD